MSSDKQNRDFVSKDELAGILGPGNTVKLLKSDEEESIPGEVSDFLLQHGIGNTKFQCKLAKMAEGSEHLAANSITSSYVQTWTCTIPTFEWVKLNHGPGTYELSFVWSGTNQEDERKTFVKGMSFVISEQCRSEYKAYQLKKKIEDMKDLKESLREDSIEDHMSGQMLDSLGIERPRNPSSIPPASTDPMKQLKDSMAMLRDLGVPIGGLIPQGKGFDWKEMLPVIATLAGPIVTILTEGSRRSSEQFQQMMIMMMGIQKESSNQLIEIMKANAQNNTGRQAMEQMLDMAKGAIDLKALATPEKESLADKLFGLVENMAPVIAQIVSQAKSAKDLQNSMMGQAATGFVNSNPEFQALKNNPVELAKFVNKWDNFFGWEQTDVILEVMGVRRPDTNPREMVPKYPAGDPRNGATVAGKAESQPAPEGEIEEGVTE